MTSAVIKIFLSQPGIEINDGLYCQKNLNRNSQFEDLYLALRKKEGRLYEDALPSLPNVQPQHPLIKEWKIRKRSADRLIGYFKKRRPVTVLEVGCGNGWLIHYIHSVIRAEYLGIDINKTELQQGVNAFGHNKNLFFLHADLLSSFFNSPITDVVIVASSIQYFADLRQLIQKLLKLLKPGGQIHILDSPIYEELSVDSARHRSANYFSSLGIPEMQSYYFHHSWESLRPFNPTIIYNPDTMWNRTLRQLRHNSPFPWIIIQN